jgi:hypothetical protein
MTKNLWGELPKTAMVKTPYAILLEQAAILRDMTNGLLSGDVKRIQTEFDEQGSMGERFKVKLLVVAPALANYSYTVVVITYPVSTLYPVTVNPSYEDKYVKCDSEEEFLQTLEQVLSSGKTLKVVANLLAQIQADEG